MHAIAEFDVTSWDQAAYEASVGETDSVGPEGPGFARATIRKTFRGDLEGRSVAELLTCQADPEDLGAGAGYVASEQVVGSLDGREGSFVIQHWGLSGGNAPPSTAGHVVPGSGTGALIGLTGTIEIAVDAEGRHTLSLDYELA